ncbi:uncharacterized protein DNG_01349 [Cephalotrichum gorgonifer]|uniref:SUN domain-containing protein n=1 Tax=Cephalotrichum gorgonifer TaxID=2041049 RepID=A0AAE8MQD5_9PEZI|nr:uncharacterized protein DNG_01349 [Cephalotrichum gorgonifer]
MSSQGRVNLRTALVLFFLSTVTVAIQATSSFPGQNTAASFCLPKTINHVTHTLPQQCLRGSWTPSTSAHSPSRTDTHSHEPQSATLDEPASYPADEDTPSRRQDNLILSFEEWKELMLREHGQAPTDAHDRERSPAPQKSNECDSCGLDVEGDDSELSLSFDVPSVQPQGTANSIPSIVNGPQEILYEDGKGQYSLGKDAGKTCKERFSYSSFDAGATVLKASPGAKNPKAILLENKDSYMLFECTAEEKYVIVELSDDILVDTVVLANFEFFSSMVRHFRLSVSDRYPAKIEKWRQLGLFEAKNARDIQPFLVENPQIWAKYVRVDFLTYYGNEYYCPVSLLRVHGTRMLESWKETEGTPEDEAPEREAGSSRYIEAAAEVPDPASALDSQEGTSGLRDGFYLFGSPQATCPAPVVVTRDAGAAVPDDPDQDRVGKVRHRANVTNQHFRPQVTESPTAPYSPSSVDITTHTPGSSLATPSPSGTAREKSDRAADAPTGAAQSNSSVADVVVQSKPVEPAPSQPRNRTSTSSSHSTLPTVQESFFKTVSKRLQLLETNMTWSLKYVEDQSRHIQEALVRIDGRRLEAETLLTSLNHTVHVELRTLRQQYDQVWQSTVIALETQREQSQSELVALSSRLNVLADEVVFQKRMSIGQSILLLCCLVLIIFSRSVTYPLPLANSQPGPGNFFPSRPGPTPGALPSVAGVSSGRSTEDSKPPAYPINDGLHHYGAASPGTKCVPKRHGERASSARLPEIHCEPYGTPGDTGSEEEDLGRPPVHSGFHQDGAEEDHANLAGMPGRVYTKKPLPPLPE